MAKAKKILIAVEDVQPDTMRAESTYKYLDNFICIEPAAASCFEKCSRRNSWKETKNAGDVVKKLIADRIKPKGGVQFWYNDEIVITEPNLSSKIKANTPYIYRLRCSDNASFNTDKYLTVEELISEISKKIRNKYAMVLYDGNRERIEYSEKEFSNIIARMSPNTCSVDIAQLDREGMECENYNITIYRNMLG